jgi:D-inositol-3-phosphate glycosyltransferase
MNVAIISYHTCPLATLGGKHTGGMNVYIRDLTKYLGEFGVHADVFTRSEDEHVPHVLHDLGCGNRIIHIPAGPEYPVEKNRLPDYIDEFVEGILKVADSKRMKYDLIHSHYWMSGVASNSLKEVWDVPVIQMFHTLELLKNKAALGKSEMENIQRIQGEKNLIQTIDKIIASTIDEKQKLINLYGASADKIIVIPPGVDISRFYPIPKEEAKEFIDIPSDENMLLFVGRIEPLKGVDTLIHALAQMNKADVMENCPHYLYIIGGEPEGEDQDISAEMKRLKELCEGLGLNDLIIFLGKKDQNTLQQHLVQDGITGYTVPSNNPTALEEKITQLMCQSELRQRMSEESVRYARTFDWDVIIPRITAVFDDLLLKQ